MFTPTLYAISDIQGQHRILTEIFALVDSGILKSSFRRNSDPSINADNLRKAHAAVKDGMVLAGLFSVDSESGEIGIQV